MDDIATRCITIIANSKNIPADTITLASTFDELNVDSLDKINISFEVEEAFAIEIPDEALSTLKTVGDMVEGVTRLRAHPKTPLSSKPAILSQASEITGKQHTHAPQDRRPRRVTPESSPNADP